MKQVRAVIADDEEALRDHLKRKLLLIWPELVIAGEAGDGSAALRLIEDVGPDVAFLDVQMPGMTGIEVARKIAGTCAIEEFENEALDYLLKPVTEDRLEKTVKRLKERLNSSLSPHMSEVVEKVALAFQKPAARLQWIKAQDKDGVRLIPADEIYYFKATDKYTTVRTRDSQFLIRKTIQELEEELDPNHFWRVHRSAIVNVRAVLNVSRSLAGACSVKFKDIHDELLVSRAYSHLFKQM
jgi:DNA-binding LytR/AlgR family response regulator